MVGLWLPAGLFCLASALGSIYSQGRLALQVEPGSHKNCKSLSPPCSVSDLSVTPACGEGGHQMPQERRLLGPFLHLNSSLKRSLRQPFAFSKLPSLLSVVCIFPLPLPCLSGSITAFLCAPQGRWCPQEAPDQKRSGVAGRFGGGGGAHTGPFFIPSMFSLSSAW